MVKFLDETGVDILWGKTKTKINDELKAQIIDKLGVANGFASLDANAKLPTSQLPTLKSVGGTSIVGSGNVAFKTINNNSIVGDGNITLDLNIYSVVEALPTGDAINPNKIYLLLSKSGVGQNLYTEYAYVNNKWEEFGKYKADVDLTNYVKKTDLASDTADGLLRKEYEPYLKAVARNNNVMLNFKGVAEQQDGSIRLNYDIYDGSDDDVQFSDIPIASATASGVMTKTQFAKLDSIASNATSDSALTEAEINAILV